MPLNRDSLVGVWRKVKDSCGLKFPDAVEFKANGQYVRLGHAEGTYTLWDIGTFRVERDGRVGISTATDKVVPYAVTISGDVATFVDDAGCEVQYRRGDNL